ncbi:MAG: DUF2807 domain-containing protein [Tannerellaceae bacterium]|jgi:hypothetical protein|nr:DUF2807 domain-containing protein [Tannerellaceae bacterium]
MKTKLFVLLTGLLTLAAGLHAAQKVKGNGNVITRTISITDYDEISIAGNMTFEYEQSDAAPFLSITTDENIFQYLRAEVKGHKLSIGPEHEGNRFQSTYSYNLEPTVYKVKSNSRDLKKLSKAGSGHFMVLSPLNVARLHFSLAGSGILELTKDLTCEEATVDLAGSGRVNVNGALNAARLNLNLAGSGRIELAKDLTCEEVKVRLSGSGRAKIGGSAQKASYAMSGSGRIEAFGCKTDRANVTLSGSGRVELFTNEELVASSSGSGNILYRGKPSSIKKSTSGSGSVRQDD